MKTLNHPTHRPNTFTRLQKIWGTKKKTGIIYFSDIFRGSIISLTFLHIFYNVIFFCNYTWEGGKSP